MEVAKVREKREFIMTYAEETCLKRSSRTTEAKSDSESVPTPTKCMTNQNKGFSKEVSSHYPNAPLPAGPGRGVAEHKLTSVAPPPDMPSSLMPNTGSCKWKWDENSRVLLAEFSMSKHLHFEDEKWLWQMMERDDITVISSGLIHEPGLDPSMWNTACTGEVLKSEYHHKIRRFNLERNNDIVTCLECDEMVSMTGKDYDRYCRKREQVLSGGDKKVMLEYEDHNKRKHNLDVKTTILYMIDLDIHGLIPRMYKDLKGRMRLPGMLPGGTHCMMSEVSSTNK